MPRLVVGLAVILLVGGCDGSSGADSVAEPSTVAEKASASSSSSSVPPSSTSSGVVAELQPEFVAWVAPVDFEDVRLGWDSFVLPSRMARFPVMADCWESNGYAEFADHIREQMTTAPLVPTRFFPDFARLSESGLSREPSPRIDLILTASGPDGIAVGLSDRIAEGPNVGLDPQDVAAVQQVGSLCFAGGGNLAGVPGNPDNVGVQWVTVLGEVDESSDIAEIIEGTVMPCLRGVGPVFVDTADLGDWWSTALYAPDGPEAEPLVRWGMPEEVLVEWGREFATCMAPLVEARRAARVEARDAWLDEWRDQLLEFQAEADETLAGVSG